MRTAGDENFENQAVQAKGRKVISGANSWGDKYKWEILAIGEAGNNKWA